MPSCLFPTRRRRRRHWLLTVGRKDGVGEGGVALPRMSGLQPVFVFCAKEQHTSLLRSPKLIGKGARSLRVRVELPTHLGIDVTILYRPVADEDVQQRRSMSAGLPWAPLSNREVTG